MQQPMALLDRRPARGWWSPAPTRIRCDRGVTAFSSATARRKPLAASEQPGPRSASAPRNPSRQSRRMPFLTRNRTTPTPLGRYRLATWPGRVWAWAREPERAGAGPRARHRVSRGQRRPRPTGTRWRAARLRPCPARALRASSASAGGGASGGAASARFYPLGAGRGPFRPLSAAQVPGVNQTRLRRHVPRPCGHQAVAVHTCRPVRGTAKRQVPSNSTRPARVAGAVMVVTLFPMTVSAVRPKRAGKLA